jgi:hypothetical protein
MAEQLRKALILNEIGGDEDLIYKFSDADGVRTGKSGYSFGLVQFDTQNNFDALHCLEACGFTIHEVVGIIRQDIDVTPLNARLRSQSAIVDRFDKAHINKSVQHCDRLVDGYGIRLASDGVMLHIVDYHNQFYMTPGGKLHRWLQDRNVPITAEMVLNFKLEETRWGQKRPDDVQRRWRNIEKILEG